MSTTGKLSRELCELRRRRGESGASDFLTIGGMGHASSIALGVALAQPHRLVRAPTAERRRARLLFESALLVRAAQVVCLDGDGAALMHLGALAIIGRSGARNYRHVVLNNGAHDSVGGQPTVALDISLVDVARACGYARCGAYAAAAAAIR